MRLEVELPPDPPDRGLGQPCVPPSRPETSACPRRCGLQGGDQDLLDPVQQDRGRTPRPRLVDQPVQPEPDEPGTPAVDGGLGNAELGSDLLVRFAVGTAQHDPRPVRKELRGLGPGRPPCQLLTLNSGQHQVRPGRPGRGSSDSPATRRPANRDRHLRTVIGAHPRLAATARSTPSAQARTIRARSARRADTAPRPARQLRTLIIGQHQRRSSLRHSQQATDLTD